MGYSKKTSKLPVSKNKRNNRNKRNRNNLN